MTNGWGLPGQPFMGPETSGGKCSRLTGTQVEDLGGPEVALGGPRLLAGFELGPPSWERQLGRACQEPWPCSQPFSKELGEKLYVRKTQPGTGRVKSPLAQGLGS